MDVLGNLKNKGNRVVKRRRKRKQIFHYYLQNTGN